jgi:sigma-B regulation protein RsbU (phosphoserine phosphatase)
MAMSSTITLTDMGRQDRPRRRSLRFLSHWRIVVAGLALCALVFAAAYSKRRSLDVLAAAAVGAVGVGVAMRVHSKRVRERLARTIDDSDTTAMLDLGSAARASRSLDEFLNNVAQRIAETTKASSVSILLRDSVSGRFYCRYRYPTLAAGLNSEPIWLDKNSFVVRRLRSLSMPLALDPADFPSWVDSLSGESRLRRKFECDVLTALETRLLVQVFAQDELTAMVSIGPGPMTQFDASVKRMMMALANQVSLAIENSFLVKRVADGERLRREIEMAAEVQRTLLPTEAPHFKHLEISTFFQPARDVAGDYFDFFPVDQHRFGICVADVAGKGISAALLMSTIKALLRSHAAADTRGTQNTAGVIASVNRLLCEFTEAPRYTTLFYAEFDSRTRALTYVNAGHNPPHIVRGGQSLPLNVGGTVLGLFPDAQFEEDTVALAEEDALVAYTDGILEACNPAGLEFGEHNILSAIRTHTRSADSMLNAALKGLREWCDGTPFDDDATLLIARVT